MARGLVRCGGFAVAVVLLAFPGVWPCPGLIGVPLLSTELLSNAYLQRGQSYFKKGEYDQAITACNQAIRLAPKFALAYAWRGRCYGGKGEYDRAIADCNQALSLAPELAAGYAFRGISYDNQNDTDRAIADFTERRSGSTSNLSWRINAGRRCIESWGNWTKPRAMNAKLKNWESNQGRREELIWRRASEPLSVNEVPSTPNSTWDRYCASKRRFESQATRLGPASAQRSR